MSGADTAGGLIRQTPLLRAGALRGYPGPVAWKLENLQRTGSFKLRGAAAKLAALSAAERARGVIASSAGNHGAGVALAARELGARAKVVVPRGAPASKQHRIASLGAEVLVRGSCYDEAESAARDLAAREGAIFVSPFDDEIVIEGNGGSLADEIWSQAEDLGLAVCPVGGGGLIGGMARRLAPRGVRIVGVQPENNCAMYESLKQDRALTTYEGKPTLAEGCEGAVSERTYALAAEHVAEISLVSEEAIRRAVAFCFREIGTIVECSAAVAVAGLLEGVVRPPPRGATVVVVSGGNIEPDLLDEILRSEP
jgi:threonine dehydratase